MKDARTASKPAGKAASKALLLSHTTEGIGNVLCASLLTCATSLLVSREHMLDESIHNFEQRCSLSRRFRP